MIENEILVIAVNISVHIYTKDLIPGVAPVRNVIFWHEFSFFSYASSSTPHPCQ